MTQTHRNRNGTNMTQINSQQYVFGYGSLIDRASRTRTNPSATYAIPVVSGNISRGWWIHGTPIGYSTCFLAIQPQAGARCNGVIYPVNDIELAALDKREAYYTRIKISANDITRLDGGDPLEPDALIWTYAVEDGLRTVATPEYPIVQSYVDICLNGCFDIEDTFPQAKAAGYIEMFITETHDWSYFWENDRIFPRRPLSNQPRAFQIDRALRQYVPDFFEHIQIQPAHWKND